MLQSSRGPQHLGHWWTSSMTVDNPFVLLGVDGTATIEEITTAWKEKVKKLHPDRYPDVSPEFREALNRETARVNGAYQMLKSDLLGSRSRFGTDSNASDHLNHDQGEETREEQPRQRPTRPSGRHQSRPATCDVCSSLHVEQFSFTRQVGMIFTRRVAQIDVRLCRSCALSVGRDCQSRTLATGWWGMISFFANFAYVFQNAGALRRASRMARPEPPPGYRTSPLDPGREIWRRPRAWIGPVILAVLIVAGVLSDSTGATAEPRWQVGNCVKGSNYVSPVSCDSAHLGRIVASVRSESLCPSNADGVVTVDETVFCIDEDL